MQDMQSVLINNITRFGGEIDSPHPLSHFVTNLRAYTELTEK